MELNKKQNILWCIAEFLQVTNQSAIPPDKNLNIEEKVVKPNCRYCHERIDEKLELIMKQKLAAFKKVANDAGISSLTDDGYFHTSLSRIVADASQNVVPTELLLEPCFDDTEWQFTQCCQKLMLALIELSRDKNKEFNHENQPNLFGVNDAKMICSLLELFIAFSVYPYLLSGVSVPYKVRKEIDVDALIKRKPHQRKLFLISSTLLHVLQEKSLHFILFPVLCKDLIALLLQLCYCPESFFMEFSEHCICSDKSLCCKKLSKVEREWCRTQLEKILNETYQPLIVQELLRLQRSCVVSKNKKCRWFLRVVGQYLSQCILKENGVKLVMQGILDSCDTVDAMSWKRYESIGKVIAHVPQQVSKVEDYYKIVCPQLLRILETESLKAFQKNASKSSYQMVTVNAINEMLNLHAELMKEMFFDGLMNPVSSLLTEQDMKEGVVTLNEEKLMQMMCCLQTLLTNGTNNDKLTLVFTPYLHVFFVLLAISNDQLRKILQETLPLIMSPLSDEKKVEVFSIFMFQKFHVLGDHQVEASMNLNIQCVDSDLSICFALNQTTCNGNTNVVSVRDISAERRVTLILSLLKQESMKDVCGSLFINLLSQLCQVQQVKVNVKEEQQTQSTTSKELLEIDHVIEDIKYKIELLSLISAVIDTFSHSVLQNTPQIVKFIKNLLDLFDQAHHGVDGFLLDNSFNDNTIDMTLMLISTLLGTGKLTSNDYSLLIELTVPLEKVSQHHPNDSTRRMANDLSVFIATKGAVKPEQMNIDSNNGVVVEDDAALYQNALRDVTDELLPTRGHGLIQLTNLLLNRNPYALKNHEKLLELFEANVSHDDSYLYLSAIDGLVALTDKQHKRILPLLCRKFARFHAKGKTMSSDLRLKLGEAIVKACRLCNEILPMYTTVVLPSLMTGVKDHESAVRASSLSAMGEVCQMLRFSIGSIITEVFACLRDVLLTEKAVEVRRAAVQVFALLFKGLGSSTLQTLRDLIRDIYRLLKLVQANEKDEITKLHADNALNILDDIMRESLFASCDMKKGITVLN